MSNERFWNDLFLIEQEFDEEYYVQYYETLEKEVLDNSEIIVYND